MNIVANCQVTISDKAHKCGTKTANMVVMARILLAQGIQCQGILLDKPRTFLRRAYEVRTNTRISFSVRHRWFHSNTLYICLYYCRFIDSDGEN